MPEYRARGHAGVCYQSKRQIADTFLSIPRSKHHIKISETERNTEHPYTWLVFSMQLCLASLASVSQTQRLGNHAFFNECFWLVLESSCGFVNSLCWFNFSTNERGVFAELLKVRWGAARWPTAPFSLTVHPQNKLIQSQFLGSFLLPRLLALCEFFCSPSHWCSIMWAKRCKRGQGSKMSR